MLQSMAHHGLISNQQFNIWMRAYVHMTISRYCGFRCCSLWERHWYCQENTEFTLVALLLFLSQISTSRLTGHLNMNKHRQLVAQSQISTFVLKKVFVWEWKKKWHSVAVAFSGSFTLAVSHDQLVWVHARVVTQTDCGRGDGQSVQRPRKRCCYRISLWKFCCLGLMHSRMSRHFACFHQTEMHKAILLAAGILSATCWHFSSS